MPRPGRALGGCVQRIVFIKNGQMEVGRAGSRQEQGRAPLPPPQPSPRVPAASKAQPDLARLAQEKDKVVTNPSVVCTRQMPLRGRAGAGRGGTVPAAVRVLLPSRGSPGWAAPEGQPPVSLPLSAGKTAKPPRRWWLPHGHEAARPLAPWGVRLRDRSLGVGSHGQGAACRPEPAG